MIRARSLIAPALVLALPVSAQNLLTNPSFDADVLGWETPPGPVLVHNAADGFLAAGAAETEGVVMTPGFSPSTGIRQCVDLAGMDPAMPQIVQGAVRPVNHDAFLPAITVTWHGSAQCGPPDLGQTSVSGPTPVQGQWTVVEGPAGPVPGSAVSAFVVFLLATTSTAPDTITRFDDLFFGVDPLIFTDGFESGDTTRWSTAIP